MSDSIKHILVVEDDLNTRETLKLALETEGYRVSTAMNGQVALDQFNSHPDISLILLDMMMPVMNGREFLDAISTEPGLVKTPVIIVSADLAENQRTGSVAYLPKPADLNVLLSWIQKFSS